MISLNPPRSRDIALTIELLNPFRELCRRALHSTGALGFVLHHGGQSIHHDTSYGDSDIRESVLKGLEDRELLGAARRQIARVSFGFVGTFITACGFHARFE